MTLLTGSVRSVIMRSGDKEWQMNASINGSRDQ